MGGLGGHPLGPSLAEQELAAWEAYLTELERRQDPERTCAKYYHDPVGFVRDCVRFPRPKGNYPPGLTPYQEEVLTWVPTYSRVAVRGPRGLGKSTTAALLILWFALTRDMSGTDWKVVTTAGSWQQLTDFLWPEVRKWAYCLDWEAVGRPPFSERTELMKTGLSLRHGLATAGSPDQPQKLEGAHADSVLYVLDEAKLIIPDTFDAMEGAFSGAGEETGLEAYACAISTPGAPAGRFYDIHRHAEGLEDWHTRHVTLEEAIAAGRMTWKWVRQREKLWGRISALFQNHVLGEFCADDEDAVVPLAWVEAAQERWRAWEAAGSPEVGEGQHVIGVDVARSGADKSVAAVRHGPVVTRLVAWAKADTMVTTGRVKSLLAADRSAQAVIDVIGIGAGVYDRLREQGENVEAFNAGKKTGRKDRTGQWRYVNCLTGDARALPMGDLLRIYRSRHEGSLFRVKTTSGDDFTATPNHKVLTPRGWVAVQSLHAGDQLCDARAGDAPGGTPFPAGPEVDHMPPTLSEVYRAADITFGSERVEPGAVDFHGDRPVGEVDVVTVHGGLLGLYPTIRQHGHDGEFVGPLVGAGAFQGGGLLAEHPGVGDWEGGVTAPLPDHGMLSSPRQPLGGGKPVVDKVVGFLHCAELPPTLGHGTVDRPCMDTELHGEAEGGLPGRVTADGFGFVKRDGARESHRGVLAAQWDALLTEDPADDVAVNAEAPAQSVDRLARKVAPGGSTSVDLLGIGKEGGFRAAPAGDAVFSEDFVDCSPVGMEVPFEGCRRLASGVSIDKVGRVEVTSVSTHGGNSFVYTMETTTGAYCTASIVHKNCRSAAWWSLREQLDPANGADLALPPDDELAGDLTALHWKPMSDGKLMVESKDDIKRRIGRSTDKGDAVMQSTWPAIDSFMDIWGLVACPDEEKCGRLFAAEADGKLRTQCPYCRTALEDDLEDDPSQAAT